jgi:CIC family chloride channel protein
MGAMLGVTFGQIVNMIFPSITAPAGAYGLVGMSAFFSGAAHAPVTAILIMFEMTSDYNIILPLMLATVISTLFSRLLNKESIYTLNLSRRGVHLDQGRDIDVMQGVKVGEIMTTDVHVVSPEMPLSSLAEAFLEPHHHGFPVVGSEGDLVGVVTIQDFDKSLDEARIEGRTVGDIATCDDLLVAYPDEPVWEALRRLSVRDVGRLPVLERDDSRHLVGIVRRSDIIRAYKVAIINRSHHQHKAETLKLEKLDDATFPHLMIPQDATVVGMRVKEVDLPIGCLIVSVLRGKKQQAVHGNTIIHAGDKVTVFTNEECSSIVRDQLSLAKHIRDDEEESASPKQD